jgi:hypothetical protein
VPSRQRDGKRKPVEVRHGRATVTGTLVPEVRNYAIATPPHGTQNPEEVHP